MKIWDKLASACDHYAKYKRLTPSRLTALSLFFQKKFRVLRGRESHLEWEGLRFLCRGKDIFAAEEVLLNKEYAAITRLFPDAPPRSVIDAGANIGLFALFAFSLYPETRIHSYEAGRETFALLARNRKLATRFSWEVSQAALCGHDGQVFFEDTEFSRGGRIDFYSPDAPRARAYSVAARSLKSLITTQGGDVDLLKCDIEGAEEMFFISHPEALRSIRHCVVELHPGRCDTQAVVAILRGRYRHLWHCEETLSPKPLVLATDSFLPNMRPYG